MEEVSSIPGNLPPLAEFPSQSLRAHILPEEWQACLDAWVTAIEFRLRLLPEHFRHLKLSERTSGFHFLLSYLRNWNDGFDQHQTNKIHHGRESNLHRYCFLLTRRILLEIDSPYDCPPRQLFEFLSGGSSAFGSSAIWRDTLAKTWKRTETEISAAIETIKSRLIQDLPHIQSLQKDSILTQLHQVTALGKILPEAGVLLMTGSDYLDSLVSSYETSRAALEDVDSELEQNLTANLYFCLGGLMNVEPPQNSLLLDHLYSLKAAATQNSETNFGHATILSSLLCSTTFLRHLDKFLATHEQKRGSRLLSELHLYRENTLHLHPISVKKNSRFKGKARATTDMEIHKASQISQIHDLFPDLSTPYILRLLDHFSNDVEAVTAALLEPDSMPPRLRDRDASDEAERLSDQQLKSFSLSNDTASLPARKNVFDDDEFDNLRVSASKLHIGQRDNRVDPSTSRDERAKRKAAIMAALAAIDSDDDERDDTYDFADVGGTVDDTLDTDSRSQIHSTLNRTQDPREKLLFGAWRNTPSVFARDSKTRLSQPRQELKRETGMSDEQLEGWAIVLERDRALLARLEKKYSLAFAFGGNQHTLAGTRWRKDNSEPGTEEEDSEIDRSGQATGMTRGRGRSSYRGTAGRGNGRGGGKTSGPSSDPATHAARRRKEQGRGRGGANHNRREGRAKKMGRGMAGMPA